MVKAVYMVGNSGSTSYSIISCLGPEIFVQINRILSKILPLMKVMGSGNYDTPCIFANFTRFILDYYTQQQLVKFSSHLRYWLLNVVNESMLFSLISKLHLVDNDIFDAMKKL